MGGGEWGTCRNDRTQYPSPPTHKGTGLTVSSVAQLGDRYRWAHHEQMTPDLLATYLHRVFVGGGDGVG